MVICSYNLKNKSDLRVRQKRESPVDCRVINIITSAKYFNNHARYLKNIAKSCKKLCKILTLSILSNLAYYLNLFMVVAELLKKWKDVNCFQQTILVMI